MRRGKPIAALFANEVANVTVAAAGPVSPASLVFSSAARGAPAEQARAERTAHLVVVALVCVGSYGVVWLTRFALYQLVLFRAAPSLPSRIALGVVGPTDRSVSVHIHHR